MSLLNSLMGKIIPPKVILNRMSESLSETFKKKVDTFDVIYKADKPEIYFKINGVKVPFADSEKFCKIIKSGLAENIPNGSSIDIAIVKHSPAASILELYYTTTDGKKETQTNPL